MALGDKIELLRVRLEQMLGEQTFIEGETCDFPREIRRQSRVIAAYAAIQSDAVDTAVFEILGRNTSALRLLQVTPRTGTR